MRLKPIKYSWDEKLYRCTKCWEFKDKNSFHKRGIWIQSKCKDCVRGYYMEHREKIKNKAKDYYLENRENVLKKDSLKREINPQKYRDKSKKTYIKNREAVIKATKEYKKKKSGELWFNLHSFHTRAYEYVDKHWLKPRICPICGSENAIEIHHPSYENYDKWKEIVFCCRRCHKRIHSWKMECPQPIDLFNNYNQ